MLLICKQLSRERKHFLLLLASILAVYSAYLTRTYYWDGVLFSLNIESVHAGQAPVASLIHPNHLMYSVLGYAVYTVYTVCGLHLRAISVLQIFNVALSVIAAYVLYKIALRLTNTSSVALFCTLLFAFGATWWKFSTDADAYIVSVLFLLSAMWFLLRDPPLLLAVALCHSLAMLFHELAIFFYAPVILYVGFWKAVAYVAGTGAAVAAVYAICYPGGQQSFFRWIASYASDSGFTRSFGQLVTAYLASYPKLFVGGKLGFIRDYFSLPVALALALALMMLVRTILLFRNNRPLEDIAGSKTFLVVWAWLLPSALFLASWDPASAFHKLFIWPPIVLLIGVYLRRYAPSLVPVAIAIAAWNFAAFIYPHSHTSTDPVLSLAQKIDRELPKNAIIYHQAFGPDDWYLKYFAPGRVWLQLPTQFEMPASPAEPVCFETTALQTLHLPPHRFTLRWDLVSPQHNIRLDCIAHR